MDDDVGAAELLHHGAGDCRAAFGRGNIRSHEQTVRREVVRPLARGAEHSGAGFAQPRHYGCSYALGAAGNERPVAREFASITSLCQEGPPSKSLPQTSLAAILRKWQE